MIGDRILSYFKSIEDEKQKGYSVLIDDISHNKMDCDQESITIKTKTVRVPPSLLLLNYNTVERDLVIRADIDINDDKLYYGKLSGYINGERVVRNNEVNYETSSHSIEVLRTPLQKTVKIIFNEPFDEMPYIGFTIDESDRKLYREAKCDFNSYIVNNKYTGVLITFEGLKTRKVYPNVGIMIVGDKPKETYYLEENQKLLNIEVIKDGSPVPEINVSRPLPNPNYIQGSTEEDEKDEFISNIKITDSCGKTSFILTTETSVTITVVIDNEEKIVTIPIGDDTIINKTIDMTEEEEEEDDSNTGNGQ